MQEGEGLEKVKGVKEERTFFGSLCQIVSLASAFFFLIMGRGQKEEKINADL